MKSKKLAMTLLFSLLVTSHVFANEKDIYEFSWLDPDKEVYVLQNRELKKFSLEFKKSGATCIPVTTVDHRGRINHQRV